MKRNELFLLHELVFVPFLGVLQLKHCLCIGRRYSTKFRYTLCLSIFCANIFGTRLGIRVSVRSQSDLIEWILFLFWFMFRYLIAYPQREQTVLCLFTRIIQVVKPHYLSLLEFSWPDVQLFVCFVRFCSS